MLRTLVDAGVSQDRLKDLYKTDRAARALFDLWKTKSNLVLESRLDRLVGHLGAIPQAEVVAALRKLAQLSCGQFIVGRKGHPSRFLWAVDRVAVAKAATGTAMPVEMVEHRFRLRPNEYIAFNLPIDLTPSEAARIADFVRTLPIVT